MPGVVKVQGRMYTNLGHIYWKTLKIHEILIIFYVFWTQKLKFLNFGIYLPIFVKNMVIFENSMHNFGADLSFSVRAMGQIYFQFVE